MKKETVAKKVLLAEKETKVKKGDRGEKGTEVGFEPGAQGVTRYNKGDLLDQKGEKGDKGNRGEKGDKGVMGPIGAREQQVYRVKMAKRGINWPCWTKRR